jgi:hypothetical protein
MWRVRQLKIESGRLRDLLLIARQSSEVVGEGVSDAKVHSARIALYA